MDILQVLILSAVEGITEFLPISSTGHLVLTSELLRISQTDFVKSFEVIIQLGAILAVVALYWKKLIQSKALWLRLIAAFIPTAVIGFAFYSFIKHVLLGNPMVTLWALFLGGIALIVIEKLYKEQPHHVDTVEKLSIKKAVVIGFIQSLSMIPGVSRAAATIFGGLFMGLKREAAVEFSFLLAIPTMAAATGLDLIKSNFSFSANEWMLLGVGFVGAFVTAIFAIKFLVRYVQHHSFIAFGIYRIILALIFWLFMIH